MKHPVYTPTREKIGSISDLIVAPDRAVSYAIVGVGGFVGMGKHDVAVPVTQLKEEAARSASTRLQPRWPPRARVWRARLRRRCHGE